MTVRVPTALAGALLGALLAAGGARAQEPGATLTRPVEVVSVDTSARRAGYGLEAVVPDTALAFSVDRAPLPGRRFLLFDLDGDGALTPGRDGVALERYPFVVPLPEKLLLPSGQVRLALSGPGALELSVQEMDVPAELLREASYLTDLRIRSAARPLVVSDTASRHARLHADYMAAHEEESEEAPGDHLATLGLHIEDPDHSDYTEEGAEAGRNSIIYPGKESFRRALQGWYRTPYHGKMLTDPAVRAVGVAHRHGYALIYRWERPPEAVRSYVFPPDGATHMPLRFNPEGEVPDPRPGARRAGPMKGGFGPPVYMYLPRRRRAEMTEIFFRIVLREAGASRPVGRASSAANSDNFSSPWAPSPQLRQAYYRGLRKRFPQNNGLILYIHDEPLQRGTTYRVRASIGTTGGDTTWRFTTRGRPVEARTAGGGTGADACLPENASPEARQIIAGIREYRAENGLPRIPLSRSLTEVAKAHVRDLAEHEPRAREGCNVHSWSGEGAGSACCVSGGPESAQCMLAKARELTEYPGPAFELPYYTNDDEASVEEALATWKHAPTYDEMLLNEKQWSMDPWRAMGVAAGDGYAAVWLGRRTDPAGPPPGCAQ